MITKLSKFEFIHETKRSFSLKMVYYVLKQNTPLVKSALHAWIINMVIASKHAVSMTTAHGKFSVKVTHKWMDRWIHHIYINIFMLTKPQPVAHGDLRQDVTGEPIPTKRQGINDAWSPANI